RPWLAPWRARMGKSQSQCAQRRDGAMLRRNRDARGHDVVGGARHYASTGAARRAGYRGTRVAGGNAWTGAAVDAGMPVAAMLVRAHVPQAREQTLRRSANTRGRPG